MDSIRQFKKNQEYIEYLNEKKLRKHAKKTKQQKAKGNWKKAQQEANGLIYHEFLHSKYWKRVRKEILKRDHFKCRICGVKTTLEIHHASYKHHFAEHKHLEDLITLCSKHHLEWHMEIPDFIQQRIQRKSEW